MRKIEKRKGNTLEGFNEFGYHNKNSFSYNYIASGKCENYLMDLLNSDNSSAEHEKFDRKGSVINIVKFASLMKPDDGTIYNSKKG